MLGLNTVGRNVRLRPLRRSDAPQFVTWLHDSEVTNLLAIGEMPPPTLSEERRWIASANRARSGVYWAIETVVGELIGTVSLTNINERHRHAEFGIFVGNKRFWGQGYGTEAGRLAIRHGFRRLRLRRIYLYLIAYNIRAQRSYEKIGFKLEGRMRQHWRRGNVWHDRLVMGILRDEVTKK